MMNNMLPKGWVECSLSEILISRKGKKPQRLISEPRLGYQPYILIDELEGRAPRFYTNDPNTIEVTKDDVLLVWDGSIGKCGFGYDGILGSTLVALTPLGGISPGFLNYLIKFLNPQIKRTSTGSGLQHINKDFLDDCTVALPPLGEQNRITAKLDLLMSKLEQCIQSLNTFPSLMNDFTQNILLEATNGKLTKEWREEHKNIESAQALIARIGQERQDKMNAVGKKSKSNVRYDNIYVQLRNDFDLFPIPDSWEWVDIRFLMDEETPFCYGVVQPGVNDSKGNFLIRAGDLKNGSVETNALRKISRSIDDKYGRSRVSGNEILLTVVGANIGDVALVPRSCVGYNIARAVAKIPIKDFNIKYIFYWLRSSIATHWLKSEAREVARPTLNLEQLKTIPVPLPPLQEQVRIVEKIEKLLSKKNVVELRYNKARNMTEKAPTILLNKAFSGELVPQNQNDQSAEHLLGNMAEGKKSMLETKKQDQKTKRLKAIMGPTETFNLERNLSNRFQNKKFTFSDIETEFNVAEYDELRNNLFTLIKNKRIKMSYEANKHTIEFTMA